MSDQFKFVQMDSRNRYLTQLRTNRVNLGSNPGLTKSIDVVDRATRIYYVNTLEELEQLTKDYKGKFSNGHLAIVLTEKSTYMFVWEEMEDAWKEIQLGSGTDQFITDFQNSAGVVENGAVIHDLLLRWNIDKDNISTLVINNDVGEVDVDKDKIMLSSLNLMDDTTYVLTADDGRNIAVERTEVLFRDRIFFGKSNKETIDEEDITKMDNELRKDKYIKKTFDCNDEYIYFVVPHSFETPQFLVHEFLNNEWYEVEIELENINAYKSKYSIFRSYKKHNASNIHIAIL